MQSYEEKARNYFGEVCIDKKLTRQITGLGRSVPSYVTEWIVSRHTPNGIMTEEARQAISAFMNKHLPSKSVREQLKFTLKNGETLVVLDEYSVTVDLKRNRHVLRIPALDEGDALISDQIVEQYPLILGGGLWGVGKLKYALNYNEKRRDFDGQVVLEEFRPMQASSIDLDLYCEQRQHFTLAEWRNLLVSSMGYNPDGYTPEQQMYLLARLIPLIQERVNLIELAPKGTGKSFVFLNMSRYVRLISGGKVTAAVLFYNNATNQPGLLTQFDVVVFDEAQSLSFDNPGEIVGVLKDYLESGRYSRGGKHQAEAVSGIVILANIPLSADNTPKYPNLFMNLPEFLRETAFIDRLHGIIPGWKLPKAEEGKFVQGIGFKADYFGEVLHYLRTRSGYAEYVAANSSIGGTNYARDVKAIQRIATGYLKLLFPDIRLTSQEFIDFCLQPAIDLRQRVRDQLALIDQEYKSVRIFPEV